jgi:hypothetical protein
MWRNLREAPGAPHAERWRGIAGMQAPARDPTSIVASTYHGVEVGARRGLVARPLCRPLIEGSPTHFLLGAVCLSVTDVVRDGAAWRWCWCWCWGVGWMAVQTKNGWCVSQGNEPPLQPSLGGGRHDPPSVSRRLPVRTLPRSLRLQCCVLAPSLTHLREAKKPPMWRSECGR